MLLQNYYKFLLLSETKMLPPVLSMDSVSDSMILIVCKCTVSRKQLFHQAILMGGSDLCEWSIVDTIWNANAVTYARDLGRLVGCGFYYDQSNEYLVDCLLKKHYDEIVNATASIPKRVCCIFVAHSLQCTLKALFWFFFTACMQCQNLKKTVLESIGYSTLPSPPRLMRRTRTHSMMPSVTVPFHSLTRAQESRRGVCEPPSAKESQESQTTWLNLVYYQLLLN